MAIVGSGRLVCRCQDEKAVEESHDIDMNVCVAMIESASISI